MAVAMLPAVQTFRGRIEALSPIAHFGDEKTGSTPVLRAVTIYDPATNEYVRMPFVAGNAVRGYLRRHLVRDFFRRLDYEPTSLKVHHAFYTGGLLESTDEAVGTLDLSFRTLVRETIPVLSLLGTAIGNQMIDSCLKVGHLWPVCRENRDRLPPDLATDPRAQQSIRTFTDTVFSTRRDDVRGEREKDEQAIQMLVEFEAFIPGTLFHHQFTLEYASALETACFGQMLVLWAEHPFIAGKSGVGYGHIRFVYEPSPPDPAPYLEYLACERTKIIATLEEIAQRLGG